MPLLIQEEKLYCSIWSEYWRRGVMAIAIGGATLAKILWKGGGGGCNKTILGNIEMHKRQDQINLKVYGHYGRKITSRPAQ